MLAGGGTDNHVGGTSASGSGLYPQQVLAVGREIVRLKPFLWERF